MSAYQDLDEWANHLGVGTDDECEAVLARLISGLDAAGDDLFSLARPIWECPDDNISLDLSRISGALQDILDELEETRRAFALHIRGTQ